MIEEETLADDLMSLYCYDHGFSGSDCSTSRKDLFEQLNYLADNGTTNSEIFSKEFNRFIGKFIVNNFVGSVAIDLGYGLEDLTNFIKWLYDQLDIDM